jgi:aryl-alcohol dehydrogenase-like predicted oxidoreductase
MKWKMTRRGLILTGAGLAGGMIGLSSLREQSEASPVTANLQRLSTVSMPERILGKTGVKVPIFGLGGAGQTPLDKTEKEAEAIVLIEAAVGLGIRYFDTASSYGASEKHLGRVLPPYRKQIFLASKTAARDRNGAWRELEQSLKRLKTDYLDLWQLHHVSFPENLDKIFSLNGAIKVTVQGVRTGM